MPASIAVCGHEGTAGERLRFIVDDLPDVLISQGFDEDVARFSAQTQLRVAIKYGRVI